MCVDGSSFIVVVGLELATAGTTGVLETIPPALKSTEHAMRLNNSAIQPKMVTSLTREYSGQKTCKRFKKKLHIR